MKAKENICCVHAKINSVLGSVALIALLGSFSHASPHLEEYEEASRIHCLWSLGGKTYRLAALETLRKSATERGWKAKLKYLKKLDEFLQEDPAYRLNFLNHSTNSKQSDEEFLAFLGILHTQAVEELSSSQSPEVEFENLRLNFFFDHIKNLFSGNMAKPSDENLLSSLRTLQLSAYNDRRLPFKIRFFQNYYLKSEPNIEGLEDTIETALNVASSGVDQEEAASLKRLASRINFKLAHFMPPKVDAQKIQSRRQSYFKNSAKLGNSLAKYYLAEIYNDENSGFYNPDAAFNLYLGSANENCSLAAYKLANSLKKGDKKLGIQENNVKAIEWHEKASKSHPYSQYELGKHILEQQSEKKAEEGLRLIHLSAEAGYSPAQLFLGEYYRDVMFAGKDPILSFYWFHKAAEQGETQAYYPTAYALEKGVGTTRDYERAVHFYKLGDENGDSNSQVRLGKLHFNKRDGENKNEVIAFSYFKKASDAGNIDGSYSLGLMYLLGQGISQPNHTQALSLFKRASEKGHAKASEKLGIMRQFSIGEEQSYEEARKAYEKANTATALYQLAWLYKRGLGVKQDTLQAIVHWEKAAMLGNDLAAYRAGKAHLQIWQKTKQKENAQKAYLYLNQASTSFLDALYLLSYLQAKGIYCNQDKSLAKEFYLKTAIRGHADAQFKIGQYIEEQSELGWETESFKWYQQAASQGHEKAHLAVGRFYLEGIGMQRDPDRALNNFTAMESVKNSAAFAAIERLAKEEKHSKSLKFIEQQAENDSVPAIIFMAKATEEGILLPQDTSKAISLYQKAWIKGKRSAYLRLIDLERAHVLKALGIQANL
ncbi:MAG: sel1 repeat family protein [Alphaproteobacteria bacterium]|nr:sel1 repeat family protein [Alphaproteobacteria bacterium]